MSERERIEIDWQLKRKEAKKVHQRELQEYEDSVKSKVGCFIDNFVIVKALAEFQDGKFFVQKQAEEASGTCT